MLQKKTHKCKTDRNDGDNPGFRKRIQYIETLKRDSNWNKDGIGKKKKPIPSSRKLKGEPYKKN